MGGGIVFLVIVIIIIIIAIIIKNKKAAPAPEKYEEKEDVKVEDHAKKHPLQGSSLMDRFNNKGSN